MINPKHIHLQTNQPTNQHANNPVGHPPNTKPINHLYERSV